MRPLTKIIYLLTVLSLIGCAAPAAIKKEASSHLGPVCYKLFTAGGHGTYGHCTSNLQTSTTCAFAYANDGNSEACGWVSVRALLDNMCLYDCAPTKTELAAAAITLCEENVKQRGVNASCKIYAFDYDIVYGKTENVDFQ